MPKIRDLTPTEQALCTALTNVLRELGYLPLWGGPFYPSDLIQLADNLVTNYRADWQRKHLAPPNPEIDNDIPF